MTGALHLEAAQETVGFLPDHRSCSAVPEGRRARPAEQRYEPSVTAAGIPEQKNREATAVAYTWRFAGTGLGCCLETAQGCTILVSHRYRHREMQQR